MQFPDNEATRLTEVVMKSLRWTDVLKPDEPDRNANYNRAFSSIHKALTDAIRPDANYSSEPTPLLPLAIAGLSHLVGSKPPRRGKPSSYYKERIANQ